MAAIRMMGAAVGEEARADALAGGIAALLADLRAPAGAASGRVRVLYYDPPTYTMGRGTLVGEILTRAGGANVVEELGIVGPGQIGIETVLALEPEAIIMPNYADNTSTLRALGGDAIWRQVPAVRAGRVHEIPAPGSRPSPTTPPRASHASRASSTPKRSEPLPRGARECGYPKNNSHRPARGATS